MRIFVTGASGWIGSAVVTELLGAGHDVVGLARSDASAQRLQEAGTLVRRGDIDDPDGMARAAAESDGGSPSRIPARGGPSRPGDYTAEPNARWARAV